MKNTLLDSITRRLRHDILTCSTEAGSGHPTSSLSAVELMAALMFDGHFVYDLGNPDNIYNDRIIFSKGHASPLFYSLYHMGGAISYEELMSFRKFDSNLEGHPTPRFRYTEASTGSLGQGLSVGLGMALGIRLHFSKENAQKLPTVYVLLGDSEIAEGQIWEAAELAVHHKTDNLVAILDVNRLGQRGETMIGWDIQVYKKRFDAFGWNVITIEDGNNISQVQKAYNSLQKNKNNKPTIVIARTQKGAGISFLANKDGWHGKTLSKDQLAEALKELGDVDKKLTSAFLKPENISLIEKKTMSGSPVHVPLYDKPTATREAYGDFLVNMGKESDELVVLDAEVSNSTFADKFAKAYPERYFEMYIAEQNMASVAVGLSRMGFIPFISSFAAFLARAYDQIRMSQYSDANVKVVGSHAGVSIGQDGSSQMGLEDMSMMKSLLDSIVLYPSDAPSTVKLAELIASRHSVGYLRLTREKTQSLYNVNEEFVVGGSKVLKSSIADKAVIIAAGITLHEALKAYENLQKIGVNVTVIDAYSVKPIDRDTIVKHASKAGHVIVVEDHYPWGGLGESVKDALSGTSVKVTHLAVTKIPRSGSPAELLAYEQIDADAIVKAVTEKNK
jgi:transketolase